MELFLKRQALSLYKKVLKLAKSWQSLDPVDTAKEREYIKQEARYWFKLNQNLTDQEEIQAKLKEGQNRIEIAKHYRTPYQRPVYYPTGVVPKIIKKNSSDYTFLF